MDILTCAERFVLRAKSIVMRFIKTLWAALFPKPEYPASDRDVIALIRSELENRHMISDISPADLSFGYLRRDGREQMVVFSYVGGSCFVVRMDNTVHVVQKPEAVRFIAPVPINLSVDRDHQMEDSSHCWGIFVDGGHFRIDRFRKD
jgi:hypothetical protein